MSKERELLQRCLDEFEYKGVACNELCIDINKLLAQPEQTEQEPVAWMWDEMFCEDWTTVSSVIKPSRSKYVDDVRPLYTAPPKREPLSDGEITDLWANKSPANEFECVRLVEKAHGIGGGE
jgi:hypothetical protein